MYLETHTKETMLRSLCKYLGTSEESLLYQINSAMSYAQVSSITNIDIFCEHIREYVKQCNPTEKIDKILFFHLSKRLNLASNDDGLNLKELLLNKTVLSDFLASYKITFRENDYYIEIFHNDTLKVLDIDNYYGKANVARLKVRLGYFQDRQDYCFNGFALKDQLYKNSYINSLFQAPEFITDLADFLEMPKMLNDYKRNSTYYCYEYLVPLSEVIFDESDKLSNREKELFLIESVCLRIHEYNSKWISDSGNPILRLSDTSNMPKEYLMSKEELTIEKLRS